MRLRRRSATGSGLRARGVPARSRMTVRRQEAPLQRSPQLAAALRSSREAMSDIEAQLGALLAALRNPSSPPDGTAAERLRGAAAQASSAVASLGALARRR
jgi:hypothetical protein